jgi:3-hydroxyisobutyrate dehydrogenase
VSADQDVLHVVDGLIPGLRRSTIVIDCSTVSADTAREAATRLSKCGAEFLDAPVSGGVEGARDATLAIMVGGSAETFERAQPVLRTLGRTITHFGPTGSGQAAKATNQIMCAGIIQAVSDAMAFARAEGLPLDRLIDTLGKAPDRAGTSSIAPRTWSRANTHRAFACACTKRTCGSARAWRRATESSFRSSK